jgi:DNA-binding Xre family transcriptional regulator
MGAIIHSPLSLSTTILSALTTRPWFGKKSAMTRLQKAAMAEILKAGGVRKAARSLGIDAANLHRISTGARKTVTPETAAKLGLQMVVSEPKYVSAA